MWVIACSGICRSTNHATASRCPIQNERSRRGPLRAPNFSSGQAKTPGVNKTFPSVRAHLLTIVSPVSNAFVVELSKRGMAPYETLEDE